MTGIKRILSLAAVVLAVGCGNNDLPTERSSEPVKSPSFFIGIGASGETIATDKNDYSPGDTVRITGTGWQPGELVRLTLTEDPEQHGPRVWNVTADSAGNISDSSFSPEEHHFGTTFTLTALGLSSGLTAQTTFTDGTFYWRGCVNTNWSTSGNWASSSGTSCMAGSGVVATIPGIGDDVVIQNVTNDPIISAAANAKTIAIEPSGHLTVSANLTLADNVNVNGLWTQTAGAVAFNSSGKKITIGASAAATYNQTGGTFGTLGANAPDFLIESNGGATQSGGTLNVHIFEVKTGRTFSQSGAGSLLALQKDWKVDGTGTFTSTGGKVQFATNGTSSAVWASPSTATNQFFDVEFDVSVTPQAQTIGVAGNWINDAASNPNNSNNYTVVFNGSGAQSIGGTNSTTFRNLTINKTGGDLTLALNQTVTDLLNFTAGNVVTGTNRLISTSTNLANVTRTSGHVIGNFQRHIPNNNPAAITYHLGTAAAYTPLTIDVDGTGGTAGGLTGAAFGVAHPNIATSGLTAFVSRYWSLTTPPSGTVAALGATRTYKLKLDFLSGEAGNPNLSEIRRWSPSTWNSPVAVPPSLTPVYTRTLTSTEVNGFNTFSDFVVGSVDNTPPTVTIDQAAGQADPTNTSPINFTVVFSESVTGFATGDVTLSGTAGATTGTVTGSGTTYNVAVTGMTGPGTVIASIAAGVAQDGASNPNTASTSTDNTVTYDATAPTVTINQAAGQADPTGTSPINFTVVFSESVTGFATGDVTLSGTAGATTGTVTGSGTTYNVAVSGMTGSGTVIASIAAGVATDGVNTNAASTSTDNTVTYDVTSPTVTIDQAAGQADPTNASPINFTVVFSEPVTGFATGDVTLSGTAGATTGTVTGSGTTYNVAVTGMTATGTVIASIGAGVANDLQGNPNASSTSTDNSVTYDATPPDVTINQAAGQADPTGTSPINFTVVFSEPVTGFTTGDVTLSGTAGATTGAVTGSGTTYNVAVTGMTGTGTVIASIGAGVATDGVNNNTASTSTDNTVTYDASAPTVTINQAAGQADPTGTAPINFTVVFSESVTGFATGDVTLSGTAGATLGTVTGSGTTYNVAVTGMTGDGTVIASIGAAVATDGAGNDNTASTSADNSVTYDVTSPSVTINQASGQADPTNASPINFTVVFSEAVTGFATGDVTLSGTAGATTGTVTGSGTTYNVAVTGMTGTGTVVATIAAGVANDQVGNPNASSTSGDNSVIYDATPPDVTIDQAAGQADPTGTSPINFTVVFSEPVTGFATGDVMLSGTAGATTGTVTGSGTTYNVAVSGMTGSGTVIASIGAGVATDGVNNNTASTSTDNTVIYDLSPPDVTIDQASGQADPTNASPINFTVVFSEPVTGFATGDVTLSGTAGATTGTVTGSGTTYNVAVTGMTGTGTVIASIAAGVAVDGVNNGNTASTSTDNTVTYDATPPSVTINQAAGQADPTNASPINFTVVFSESVTGFATGDVTLSGTAGATTGTVTGSGTTYNVAVSGMTGSGTVIASIGAGIATDGLNNNTASTSTDNSVTYDVTAPTVTINQAAGQADPTGSSPVNFTVVFSESVTGFADADVTLSGTAGATTASVTGSGTTYNVAVSGMTGDGTVIASVGADKADDAAGNGNTASTSTDNTVTFENDGPITSEVVANPVALNTAGLVTAKVSDVTTGGSNIASAQYSIDGGPWLPMTAQDGAFNSPTEYVRAVLPGSPTTGVFEVCVRGTDAAGNTGNAECALYAVYDPQGGFVTGGGWFNSPANACKLASCAEDGSTVGKANFGFVSKYQKGATVPVGNTEFQFKAGDLNFHSSSYQWLVIAGARAQYKGTGTINGTGNYGFLITAIDGQITGGGGADRFRIKIWDKNNGDTVVYDNEMGADDTSPSATIILGGSILIHAK